MIVSAKSQSITEIQHHKEDEYNCTYKFFSSSDFSNKEKCYVS